MKARLHDILENAAASPTVDGSITHFLTALAGDLIGQPESEAVAIATELQQHAQHIAKRLTDKDRTAEHRAILTRQLAEATERGAKATADATELEARLAATTIAGAT